MSVTSRRKQVKRSGDSWREKLDFYGLKYLDMYREARSVAPSPTTDLKEMLKRGNSLSEVFRKHPELEILKSVNLTPDFIKYFECSPELKKVLREGEHKYAYRFGQSLEFMQTFVPWIESDPKMRMTFYLMGTLAGIVLFDHLRDLYEERFGKEEVNPDRIAAVAAQFFEMLAQFCRGKYAVPKGKINMELVELVRTIQEHQKQLLKPAELRQAVVSAGVAVPEGEAWRLWLWRMRKRKLIK